MSVNLDKAIQEIYQSRLQHFDKELWKLDKDCSKVEAMFSNVAIIADEHGEKVPAKPKLLVERAQPKSPLSR